MSVWTLCTTSVHIRKNMGSNMSDIKTITMMDLMMLLHQYIRQDIKLADYKVYISKDPEGNSFGTLDPKWSLQFGDDDKILTIMPYEQGLQNEDIAPIDNEKVMQELEEMKKNATLL